MKKENSFKYTACDNTECLEHLNCKRYIMFRVYKADDVKRGGGTATQHCKRFLPLKEER